MNERIRDFFDWLLVGLRFILVSFVLIFLIILPLIFLFLKVVSLITRSLPAGIEAIVGVVLFAAAMCYASYLSTQGNHKIMDWVMTGHFDIIISDEFNQKMRMRWLKAHKSRSKPQVFHIYLTNKSQFVFLAPVYPIKYGVPDKLSAPVKYQALIPITHKFWGNLPIAGDTLKIHWITTSNNDISYLHLRAVEYFPPKEEKAAVWGRN